MLNSIHSRNLSCLLQVSQSQDESQAQMLHAVADSRIASSGESLLQHDDDDAEFRQPPVVHLATTNMQTLTSDAEYEELESSEPMTKRMRTEDDIAAEQLTAQ